MTGQQLKEAQRVLRMNNKQLCNRLGVAETTLCNWKAGRVGVPTVASLAVQFLLRENNTR